MTKSQTNQSDLNIIRLDVERFEEYMELSQFAFQHKKTAQEIEMFKFFFKTEPAVCWTVLIDNQIAAMATVLDIQTYIGGKIFNMGGVAGVATWPEYRRKGFVGKLLVHAFHEMKAKSQTISFLHPFAFGFYQKFGYGTYTDQKKYTIEANQLPARVSYPGQIVRVSGYEQLKEVYEQYAKRYNGSLSRSHIWWERRISNNKPGHIALYSDKEGQAQGYLIYEVKNFELTVKELVHLNEEARVALWSFIAQHDSMIEKVTLTAPIDDTLADMLPNPRIKQEIIPYFMARIVDLESFVAMYPFTAGDVDTIRLKVIDEHATWNAGVFELQIDEQGNGRLSREPANENNKNDHSEAIKIEIAELSTLMLGYRTARQLSSLNRIHGPEEQINRLHSRIPERTTYLPDFF